MLATPGKEHTIFSLIQQSADRIQNQQEDLGILEFPIQLQLNSYLYGLDHDETHSEKSRDA